MSLRHHISATQLSEFYSCARRAYYTDRQPSENRDPLSELTLKITREGERFEQEFIASIPGLISLDKKILGLEGTFDETKRQMQLGVPAIHHGILLGHFNGVQLVCEPDILERVDQRNEQGEFLYRVGEIKNSPKVTAYHHVQLSLNAYLLESLQGSPTEHRLIDHHLHSTPFLLQDFRAIFDLILKDCLESLAPASKAPLFIHKTICLGCSWESMCHQEAQSQKDLGLIPTITEDEVHYLKTLGVSDYLSLSSFQFEVEGSSLEQERREELRTRALALVIGKRSLIKNPTQLRKFKQKANYLAFLERDKITSKSFIGFAVLHLVSGQFQFWDEAEGFLEFLLKENLTTVLLAQASMLTDLRDHFLLPRHLGRGEDIYALTSLEQLGLNYFALPQAGNHLGVLSEEFLKKPLPQEPLNVYSDHGPSKLYEDAVKQYLLHLRELTKIIREELR